MDTTAPETSPSVADPSTGQSASIGRIVVVCLLGGAVLAVALSVFVLGGAAEPVVAGGALLGFAAGWAALAWTSAVIGRAQHWAWLPAGVLGAAGSAYVAFEPGAAAMDASGWVWPVVLLGLAGWIATRSRRGLPGWSRRAVVCPIAAVMTVAAFGAGFETVREATNPSGSMTGELVSVGDHKLHISCAGTGTPTVVLEAGLGEPAVMMGGWIQPAVAPTTRVCVYDRAGRGGSEAASGPLDGPAMASDLHTLLVSAQVPGPYVLAGHSSGAVYVKVFADQYPADVAGLVLIDPQPSNAYADLPGWSSFSTWFRRYTGLAPSLARLGVMRLAYSGAASNLPPWARAQERADWATARHNRSVRDEFAELRTVLTQSQELTSIGDKPLIVVTALKDMQAGWLPLQDQMLSLSTNSVHRFAPNGTHSAMTENRDEVAVSARAITDVVEAVRSGTRLDG